MKYPLVKQNGLKNCGPACLASLIKYYGGYVSVDSLEILMHTTKNGTTAYNFIEAARKIGFTSYGLKLDNIDKITYPLVAHVTISKSYDHFVIIYKVDDKVLIGDPSSKVKYITKEEFYSIWNNVVIVLYPSKKLPNNKPKSLFNYTKDIIFKYKIIFIYLIILSFLSASISLIYSLLIRYMIDNTYIIKNTILIFIFVFILKYLLIWYKNNYSIYLNEKISNYLTNGINHSLISLPYVYYKNHRVGEVVSRFNDINSIINFINDVIVSITIIPILCLFMLFMYIESKLLFYLSLFILLIYVIINYIMSYILKKNINILKEEDASYNSLLIETLNAFETIKGINIEKYIESKLNKKYGLFKTILCKTQKKYNIKDIILDIILNSGLILIIIIGFIKNASIGTIISFYLLYEYVSMLLSSFMNFLISYKEASTASFRIQELMHLFASSNIEEGLIEYKNVTYKQGIIDIIKNINLKIFKGEKVIITGSSGSGKSTLVKCLKGYYDVDNVYINNNMVNKKIDNISYVSENDYLFEDTILENLICDDNNKIEKIKNMCQLNKNLYTFVEENGFNLSGGEKSRIILSRALLKPFDILIIDEILDKLSIEMERSILKMIFDEYRDKTIIVITHRLDNVNLYDHLIEMNNASIIKDTYL